MSARFYNITEKQQEAVIYLSCHVVAINNDGLLDFSKHFDDFAVIFNECFGWDVYLDFDKVHKAIIQTRQCVYSACIKELSSLSAQDKEWLTNLLEKIAGGSNTRQAAVKEIIQGISNSHKSRVETNKDENPRHPFFARLADASLIRESDEIFTVHTDHASLTKNNVACNYEYWASKKLTPRAGLVGIVQKQIKTSEGYLCFLVCEMDLIVPVLEHGLEKIDQSQYMYKRANNKVLSFYIGD